MSAPELVSMLVACTEYLGISDETGYQLARRGDFPGDAAMRIGGQWRISVPKLLRALHGGEPDHEALARTAELRAQLMALRSTLDAVVGE